MRSRASLLSTLACLLGGCAAGETTDDDATAGADAIPSSDAPPERETHFPSGDVDLTTYKNADAPEWKEFERFYKGRHTRDDQDDDWERIVARTEKALAVGAEAQPGKLLNFVAAKVYTQEVHWFVQEARPRIEQDYKVVHNALRGMDTDAPPDSAKRALTEVEGFIKSAASGINMLPAVTGTLHRRYYRANCDDACMESWLGGYVVGKYVREPSFFSTSKLEAVTCEFRGQVHFVIDATAGGAHSMKTLSDLPAEEEALFLPGSVFKVERIEPDQPVVCDTSNPWVPNNMEPDAVPPEKETVIHLRSVIK